jgi:hypothetical protein
MRRPAHARKESAMTPTTTAFPLPALSPEVCAFAAEKGVEKYLPALCELVRNIVPHAPLTVEVTEDPELSYNTQIVFVADPGDMDADTMFHAVHRWSSESFHHCPTTHLHVFCFIFARPPR